MDRIGWVGCNPVQELGWYKRTCIYKRRNCGEEGEGSITDIMGLGGEQEGDCNAAAAAAML